MRSIRAIVPAFLIAVACPGFGSDATTVAALRIESTPAGTTEIRNVVENALPGRRILLANDALTTSSLLVIERRRHDSLAGTRAAGVADEAPQRFRLILDGDTCELVHLNTGKHHALTRTRCRAKEAAE